MRHWTAAMWMPLPPTKRPFCSMTDYGADFRILDEPLLITGIGAAFSVDDDRGLAQELMDTFAQMRQDGTMQEIVGRYLEHPETYLEVECLEP